MIGLLTIAGLVGACALFKKRGAPIGKLPKRRIYREVAEAQSFGAEFLFDYDTQSARVKRSISEMCKLHNRTYPKRTPLTEEKYYKQLKRAYNAISGIGKTTLPYNESTIRNHRGDIIMLYRDYGTDDKILSDAIDYVIENYACMYNDRIGYYETLAYIARGGKFVWESKGVHRGVGELLGWISAPAERKLRISYLASPKKGAIYPEPFAESLAGYYGNDREVLNGVEECLMDVISKQQAIDIIMDIYIRDHNESELRESNLKDVPF